MNSVVSTALARLDLNCQTLPAAKAKVGLRIKNSAVRCLRVLDVPVTLDLTTQFGQFGEKLQVIY